MGQPARLPLVVEDAAGDEGAAAMREAPRQRGDALADGHERPVAFVGSDLVQPVEQQQRAPVVRQAAQTSRQLVALCCGQEAPGQAGVAVVNGRILFSHPCCELPQRDLDGNERAVGPLRAKPLQPARLVFERRQRQAAGQEVDEGRFARPWRAEQHQARLLRQRLERGQLARLALDGTGDLQPDVDAVQVDRQLVGIAAIVIGQREAVAILAHRREVIAQQHLLPRAALVGIGGHLLMDRADLRAHRRRVVADGVGGSHGRLDDAADLQHTLFYLP